MPGSQASLTQLQGWLSMIWRRGSLICFNSTPTDLLIDSRSSYRKSWGGEAPRECWCNRGSDDRYTSLEYLKTLRLRETYNSAIRKAGIDFGKC